MDPGPAAKRFITSSSDPSFDLHRVEGEHHLTLNACVNQGSDETEGLSRPGGDYRKVSLHRCPGEYKLAVEPPSREGIAAATFTRSFPPGEGSARAKLRASRTRRHSEGDELVTEPEGSPEVTSKVMTQKQCDDVTSDVTTKPNAQKTPEIDCEKICGEASEVMDEMKNLAVA
ncbi:Hypp5541 [Branchiostoma lanceolatum]|uniref:Hypp5541 protein n=1 Tax=Branchiostoma lanceolatum TaxID=7740 RepID=A0A8J9YR40_BRALA|nr:Hypp5541 [Branchiostoma lanceolatum]